MISIIFTRDDLTRIRLAESPDPMWEVLLSLHLLQSRPTSPALRQWRATARRQLTPAVRPLVELAPAYGYSPDFLTPSGGAEGLDAGIDGLLSTRPAQLQTDLRRLAGWRTPSVWTRDLATGDLRSLRVLTDAVRHYHRVAVAPYWPQIRATVDADRAARSRAMAGQGLEGMIGSLHPDLRWRPPVLEVHGFKVTREIHLDGRGLRIIPSYFCWEEPTLLRDPELPPVLVYPVDQRPPLFDSTEPYGAPGSLQPHGTPSQPLAALLGRTRAAVLEAVSDGCTTTELAQRVGVSAATASQHASILRAAGLINTRRIGAAVLHTLRPLGADVLAGSPAGIRHLYRQDPHPRSRSEPHPQPYLHRHAG